MTGRGRLRPMGRAAPASSSPRPAELRRATSRAPHSAGGAAGGDARLGGGAARLAAERRRVQQRRGRLLGPGGRDRDGPGAGRLLPRLPRPPAALPDRALARLSAPPPEGFERFAAALLGVATVYLVYELGRLLYGRRAGLLAALLMALMPYHVAVYAPGASGRADDVLRDVDAGPVRPLPRPAAAARGCTRPAPAWA